VARLPHGHLPALRPLNIIMHRRDVIEALRAFDIVYIVNAAGTDSSCSRCS